MNTGTHYVSLDMEADDIPDDELTPMLDFTPGLRRIPSYAENEIIINQLVQMNFSLRAAMLCVQITEAKDLETVFQFITSDDYGFYNHPYIEQENSSICIICSDRKLRHVDSLDAKQFEQARRPREGSNKTLYLSLEKTHDLAEVGVFKKKPIIDPVSCMVCFEDIERSEIITFDSKLHDICPKCFTEYLETQIKENKVLKIVCPHCSEELREETIKTLVSEDIYNKFKTFVRNIKINSDPLLKWCPNPICSEVITLSRKNAQKGKCEHCKTEICGKCGRNFHGKSSCEKQVDKDLRTFLNSKDSSKCPKCGMYVWKDSGCNHMTCIVCAYEWCWLCGSAYTKFHFINPFGCMGLQDGNYTAKNWGCLKRTFYRLGIIIGILIALPFIALIGFPILFCIIVSDTACYRNSVSREGCCCNFFYFVFFVFPLGLLLNVIVLPVAVFCLPFALIGYIVMYCYERCKLMQRVREGLRAHRQRRDSAVNDFFS